MQTSKENIFSISGNTLKFDTAQDVEQIINQINSRKLTEIKLSGNTFGVEAAKAIAEALRTQTDLQIINLSDMFTGRLKNEIPLALDAFVDVLLDKNIVELDLSDNAFGPAGAKPLMKLLTLNTTIQVLKLNNNGLGIEGGRCIATALCDAQEKNIKESKKSNLRVIQMGRNRLESPGALHLSKAFEAHSESLQQVKMPQNSIRPDAFTVLMESLAKCSHLEHLDLQDNTFTDPGSLALASALPNWQSLKILNVGECLLRSIGSKEIFRVLTNGYEQLEKLQLSFNEINEKTASCIPEMLKNKKNLILLELNGNEFDPEGSIVDEIRDILKSHGHSDALDELDEMEFGDDESDEDADSEDNGDTGDTDEALQDELLVAVGSAITNEMENARNRMEQELSSQEPLKEPIADKPMSVDPWNNSSQGQSYISASTAPAPALAPPISNTHVPEDSFAFQPRNPLSPVSQYQTLAPLTFLEPLQDASKELISIIVLPEKLGFVFKHAQYQLQVEETGIITKRRYSDFVWLNDVLSKRYSFRALPPLPPKRIVLNNETLEKRRKGLSRFVNYLFTHPVFSEDKLVTDFLSIKIEISEYKLQCDLDPIQVTESQIDFPEDFDVRYSKFQESIGYLIIETSQIVKNISFIDEIIKSESSKWGSLSFSFSALSHHGNCFEVECKDCNTLAKKYLELSEGFQSICHQKHLQSLDLIKTFSDRFAIFMEILYSIQDLFAKREKSLSEMGNDLIKKRTSHNQNRLALDAAMKNQGEFEKTSEALSQDTRELEYLKLQRNYMDTCIWSEITLVHRRKGHLYKLYSDFIKFNVESSKQISETWSSLQLVYDCNPPSF